MVNPGIRPKKPESRSKWERIGTPVDRKVSVGAGLSQVPIAHRVRLACCLWPRRARKFFRRMGDAAIAPFGAPAGIRRGQWRRYEATL